MRYLCLKELPRPQIFKHQFFFFLAFQTKIFKTNIGVVLKHLPIEMLYTLTNSHFTIKIGKTRNDYILIYSYRGKTRKKFFTNKSNVPDKCMCTCDGIITCRKFRILEDSGWKQSNDKTSSTMSFNSYVCTCKGIESDRFLNFGKYMPFQFTFTKQFNYFC